MDDIVTPLDQTLNAPKAEYASKNAEHIHVQNTRRDKQPQEHVRFSFILGLQCYNLINAF